MIEYAHEDIIRRLEAVEQTIVEVHEKQIRLMNERNLLLQRFVDAIGEESFDGKGGSGLIGKLARLENKVDGIIELKNKGIGIIMAVGIFGAVIILGIRSWITSIVGVHA